MGSMPVDDTAPQVEVADPESVAIWAAMTGAERLAIAAGMFRAARRMLESHLRAEHPTWNDERIDAEILRRFGHGTG